jgi:glycerophosphoryl diester phosphodiesterase
LALREGAEGIVLDVQLSPEGVPMVRSDPASRFDGRVRAPQHDVDAGNASLSQALRWVHGQKCMAFIRVEPSPAATEGILKEIVRARVRRLTRVIAFDLSELRNIHRMDSGVHLGLRVTSSRASIKRARALGAEVLVAQSKAALPSLIRRAHQASMLVIPWNVDSPRQMLQAIRDGVDGIVTNYPARLVKVLGNIRPAPPAGAA